MTCAVLSPCICAPYDQAAQPEDLESEAQAEDVLTDKLLLLWRPAPQSQVAFFSLEFSGPHGSRAQRENHFVEIFR